MNFHGDVMLNLSNMICGYREDRLYSFIPYAGAGFVHLEEKAQVMTNWVSMPV